MSRILHRLSSVDLARIRLSADAGQKLENQWVRKTKTFMEHEADLLIENLERTGRLAFSDFDFEEFLLRHMFDSLSSGLRVARAMDELDRNPTKRLANPRKVPATIRDLRVLYDKWRRGRQLPSRVKKQGEAIKKAYVKKIQSVWEKNAQAFLNGTSADREVIAQKIKNAARVTSARAEMIVRTETTGYYNVARRDFYDRTSSVTHYLFLAIRDKRTTAWCTDKTINGKRGRHGLVYAKTDPLLAKETPGCHWNCRSEILPLTPANPKHLALIEDHSIARRSHQCTPLPQGWVGPGLAKAA